jgi:TonB family protein
MTPRALFLPLLLFGAALAQDSAPISLSGKDHAPICHGKDTDQSDCVTPPHAISAPPPEYPEKGLRREGRPEGTVILGLVVGSDGLPRDITVSHPRSPKLDEAAIAAVKKWRFSPATKDGKPVATSILVEVRFHLY